jgi:hypothetical protein
MYVFMRNFRSKKALCFGPQNKITKNIFFVLFEKFGLKRTKLFLSSELREQLLARFSFRPLQIAEESSQKSEAQFYQ